MSSIYFIFNCGFLTEINMDKWMDGWMDGFIFFNVYLLEDGIR